MLSFRATQHLSSTPKEITIANDGVVNQTTVYAYAKHSFTTIQQLDQWGIKFEKDETGEFAVKSTSHGGICFTNA